MTSFETHNGKSLRLPDFIHVGPPRTGTTWLHEVLKGHVGLPEGKSTRFFETEYHRGIEWYADFFKDYPPNLLWAKYRLTPFRNPWPGAEFQSIFQIARYSARFATPRSGCTRSIGFCGESVAAYPEPASTRIGGHSYIGGRTCVTTRPRLAMAAGIFEGPGAGASLRRIGIKSSKLSGQSL